MVSIDLNIFHKLNLVNLVKGHQQNLSNNLKYRGSRQQSSLHQIRKTIDFMLPLPKKDFTLHAQQIDARLCFRLFCQKSSKCYISYFTIYVLWYSVTWIQFALPTVGVRK